MVIIMMIQDELKKRNISVYKFAKQCGLPYTTVNEICIGKAKLEKCTAETVYKIAKALDTTVEELLTPYLMKRSSFENFKSTICHRVKEMGDLDFIIEVLESEDIRKFYERKWYRECLYLLAMLDYLSRENNIPLCEEYNDLRTYKLEEPVYPDSILALSAVMNDESILEKAAANAIPEFRRFNIIENEVRNVA